MVLVALVVISPTEKDMSGAMSTREAIVFLTLQLAVLVMMMMMMMVVEGIRLEIWVERGVEVAPARRMCSVVAVVAVAVDVAVADKRSGQGAHNYRRRLG